MLILCLCAFVSKKINEHWKVVLVCSLLSQLVTPTVHPRVPCQLEQHSSNLLIDEIDQKLFHLKLQISMRAQNSIKRRLVPLPPPYLRYTSIPLQHHLPLPSKGVFSDHLASEVWRKKVKGGMNNEHDPTLSQGQLQLILRIA